MWGGREENGSVCTMCSSEMIRMLFRTGEIEYARHVLQRLEDGHNPMHCTRQSVSAVWDM